MKNKRLFLTIIAAMTLLLGAKDLLVEILGAHTGIITVAFITLAYQIAVVILARFYNSGNWLKGWSAAFVLWNVCTFIPQLVGIFTAWGSDFNVSFSGAFLNFMNKAVLLSNLALTFVNADWNALISGLSGGSQKKIE